MRGRMPRSIVIGRADRSRLEKVARSLCLPWFQVRRARIVLASAAGERTGHIAQQVQCNACTVRRTCLRYERLGLANLLAPAHRPGRPAHFTLLQRAEVVRLACLEP